jgi:hypothetical protein
MKIFYRIIIAILTDSKLKMQIYNNQYVIIYGEFKVFSQGKQSRNSQ